MPYSGLHFLWFAFVCFFIGSHTPPPPPPHCFPGMPSGRRLLCCLRTAWMGCVDCIGAGGPQSGLDTCAVVVFQ